MPSKKTKTHENDDWENRTLCSDESCIGTIGEDGCCRECGKPYDGDLKTTPVAADAMDAPEADVFDDEEPVRPADGDWEDRILCNDESCIGVIGPDGRCKECGKPFSKP
jgi:hypothetical protein